MGVLINDENERKKNVKKNYSISKILIIFVVNTIRKTTVIIDSHLWKRRKL